MLHSETEEACIFQFLSLVDFFFNVGTALMRSEAGGIGLELFITSFNLADFLHA